MLVQSIKHRLYLHPVEHLGALDRNRRSLAARAAPKIKPLDRYIDWNTCTAEEILRKHRVIGPLWSFVHNQKPARRIIWTAGFTIADKFPRTNDLPVGQPLIMNCDNQSYEQPAFMRTCDDQILRFDMMKIEGGVEASPLRAARKAGMVDLFRSREKDR